MEIHEAKSILEALSLAARSHQGQMRKDGRTPYVAHPARVLTIVATLFGVKDAETLTVAALHDTIEDTTTDRDDLIEAFGPQVAAHVATLSKDKRLPHDEREQAYFDALAAAPLPVKLCKLADTLDNLLDSQHLDAETRRKKVDQARELLDRFTPGFPAEWQHALDLVRRQIDETARTGT